MDMSTTANDIDKGTEGVLRRECGAKPLRVNISTLLVLTDKGKVREAAASPPFQMQLGMK